MTRKELRILQTLTQSERPWRDHPAAFERMRKNGHVYRQHTKDMARITERGRDILWENKK